MYKDQLKSKKRKKIFGKVMLGVIIILAIVGGIIYALFFTSWFDVRNVSITGPEDSLRSDINVVINEWLDKDFLSISRRSNIFLLSLEELSAIMLSRFPKLDSVDISRKGQHDIEISASQRKPIGVWCTSTSCAYFDQKGIAYAETGQSAGFLILNVVDKRDNKIMLGSSIILDDWLQKIILAKELLLKPDINVSRFEIPENTFDEFHAVTPVGWKIYFSVSTDISKQVSALASLLRERLSLAEITEYVDLRIQDRIYYK
ncbi:MAG: hypothetical protein WD898_01055 [Candidatus Paceibacterota bacterium]